MRISQFTAIALMAASASAFSSDDEPSTTTHIPQCTATSSSGSGAFFDLRPDTAIATDERETHGSRIHKDYYTRGYDYGKNFTMNVCGSVLEPVTDVVGVDPDLWRNVSAYYTSHGNIYSIGTESLDLQSRGRKLVLQYINGSPCGDDREEDESLPKREAPDDLMYDDDDAELMKDVEGSPSLPSVSEEKSTRRKSATISFLCDRDPTNTQTTIAFVHTDPYECAYFFEARSAHACASAEPHKPGSVGPGSIFGLIFIITVLVYVLGGVFYNRTISHARGWRQLPNYSLWAGIWSFITDFFVIATSSCARCMPRPRGYSPLNATSSRQRQNQEAENRLIDQLDEEWDD